MNVYTSHHLEGAEVVRRSSSTNHDSLTIAQPAGVDSIGLVLGHSIPSADRVTFLRLLSAAAENLADEINLRESGLTRFGPVAR